MGQRVETRVKPEMELIGLKAVATVGISEAEGEDEIEARGRADGAA